MFQDRLILTIWTCLQAHHPFGREAIARLYELMFERGLLPVDQLDDLSLMLLIAGCPVATSLRSEADGTFEERELHQAATFPSLRESLRRVQLPHDEATLAMFRHGTANQRGAAANMIRRFHGPRLRLFLGQLFLTARLIRARKPTGCWMRHFRGTTECHWARWSTSRISIVVFSRRCLWRLSQTGRSHRWRRGLGRCRWSSKHFCKRALGCAEISEFWRIYASTGGSTWRRWRWR